MNRIIISKPLLRELYIDQDLTTYQIAEEFGCCQTTVWKRLHEFGIKPRWPWNATNLTKTQLHNWYIGRQLSTWQIQDKFGYPRGTIHRKLREFGITTRTVAASHVKELRRDFSGNLIERAYLLGFAAGDLNVTKRGEKSETIAIKCGTTQVAQIKLFKELFSKYGRIWQGRPDKLSRINLQANVNLTLSFLLNPRRGIDIWILKRKKMFFAFLAGFSDAEGSFFMTRGKAGFALGNYDKPLLMTLQTELNKYGILTQKIISDHLKGYVGKDGYKRQADYFSLRCQRKRYLIKLINSLLPFIKHADKLEAANACLNNIKKRNTLFGNLRMK